MHLSAQLVLSAGVVLLGTAVEAIPPPDVYNDRNLEQYQGYWPESGAETPAGTSVDEPSILPKLSETPKVQPLYPTGPIPSGVFPSGWLPTGTAFSAGVYPTGTGCSVGGYATGTGLSAGVYATGTGYPGVFPQGCGTGATGSGYASIVVSPTIENEQPPYPTNGAHTTTPHSEFTYPCGRGPNAPIWCHSRYETQEQQEDN